MGIFVWTARFLLLLPRSIDESYIHAYIHTDVCTYRVGDWFRELKILVPSPSEAADWCRERDFLALGGCGTHGIVARKMNYSVYVYV